jgi:Peptidase C39 family/Tetratricopeptide repeat
MNLRTRLLFRGLLLAVVLLSCTSCITWTPRSKAASAEAMVLPDMPMQKWGIESCGPGSLSTVLQHYGDSVTMAALQSSLPKMRGGVLTLDMLIAARQKGYKAELMKGDAESITQWVASGKPAILMLQVVDYPGSHYDFFHYIVADGIDPGKGLIRVQFGDGKGRWTTFDRLEKSWNGGGHAALLIEPKKGPKKPLVAGAPPPPDAAAMMRDAVALEDHGELEAAIGKYDEILKVAPATLAWTNRGNALSQLGRKAEAEDSFRKALALDAADRDALNNLAWLLYEEKRFDEAETLARKAVAAGGTDRYLVLDTLARILAARGSCSESATTFRDALAAVPAGRAEAKAGIEKAKAESTCKG